MKLNYPLIFMSLIGIILLVALISAGLLILSVSRYASYWKSQNALLHDPESTVYVALGDSAAQGIGATSPRRGYPGLIADQLEARDQRKITLINLSKSGATIRDVIHDQIPELNELKPDILTLEIGANDIKKFDAATFERDMDELMSLLPPQTTISNLPFFGGRTRLPLFGNGQPERFVLEANVIMQRLADRYDFKLIDLHSETQAHNQFPWSYAIDYFHPNDFGYQAWARAFMRDIPTKGQ